MPQKSEVFRKAALDRLSSPEELDQLMQVTTPKGWLALAAVGSLLVMAIIWSVFGSIPTKVAGQCVVLTDGGVNNVVALSEGQVRSISVEVGSIVRKGQVVARISQNTAAARSRVTSPYDGRVLEIRTEAGSYVTEGSPIISLEAVAGDTAGAEVIVYVPAAEGKRVRPGMEAQISPSTVKKEEFGFMVGNVSSVSEFPATQQGMMQSLGSEKLVERFSAIDAPLEVQAQLTRNPDSASGYTWSSGGPTIQIDSGTLCSAQIVVKRERPISLVIPLLRQGLGV